jgi:two-component system, OmpR family, alkaline phosphatase synthesis response regulator PhoP
MNTYKILLLDPDFETVKEVFQNLAPAGYNIKVVDNTLGFHSTIKDFDPHLSILVIEKKGSAILACLKDVKDSSSEMSRPVLIVSHKDDEASEVEAFAAGADDYVLRPLRPRAFEKRVAGLISGFRLRNEVGSVLEVGPFKLDKTDYSLRMNQTNVSLNRKEFDLLFFLAQHKDKLFTRTEILREIWGIDNRLSNRTVDVHICNLREKVGSGYIKTYKGKGYKFELSTVPQLNS